MMTKSVTLPELGLIAGTRGMLGMGIGLLVADRMKPEQRRAVGMTLLAVGLLTTIPLAANVLLSKGSHNGSPSKKPVEEAAGI